MVAKFQGLIVIEFAAIEFWITGSVHIVGDEHNCKKIIECRWNRVAKKKDFFIAVSIKNNRMRHLVV